jgi:hypothetical protein
MKKLYLHIGTHKTGTTAIQQALSIHAADLVNANYIVPHTGRIAPQSGHHNIAWEISGDERFQSDFGGIAQLQTELSSSDADVILSSEDFSCAVCRNPGKFKQFVDEMKGWGLRPTIVVYFRNQVGYASSLYKELVRHGLDFDFDAFCQEIISSGQFVWRNWTFPFCYLDFVNKLSALDGTTLVVRCYDQIEHSAVEDFAQVVGLGTNAIAQTTVRTNMSPPLHFDFKVFYKTLSGYELSTTEAIRIQELLVGTDIPISVENARSIARRFFESNRLLSERFGLAPVFLPSETTRTIDAGLTMESIFSRKYLSVVGRETRR